MEVGERYGYLTCIGKDEERDSRYYLFKCDCGTTKSIISSNVKLGKTKSCGCYSKTHPAHLTYGFSHTRIDNIYKSMISRCYCKNNNRYANYGRKGVVICDEWLDDKTSFFDWSFKNGYKEGLTIDRIDVDGNYEPANCRWITYQEQANNKTNNRIVEYRGERYTLANFCREFDLDYKRMSYLLRKGYSTELSMIKAAN